MNFGMTVNYRKCRADLNSGVDSGLNGAIDTTVTKRDPIIFG